MTKPLLTIDAKDSKVRHIEKGTLMQHKEPPLMVVLVSSPEGDQPGDFSGVDIEAGLFSTSWMSNEFDFFEGTIKLTQ